MRRCWSDACSTCAITSDCTTGKERLDQVPQAMVLRRQTVEHPFGTIKTWMGSTHFLTRTLERISAEMSLQVLARNMKQVIKILGVRPMMEAIRT